MSVIVKCKRTGEYILFTKGAESSIFNLCVSESSVEDCNKSIDQFAVQGWRTLAMGYKVLTDEEMHSFDTMLSDVYKDISDKREERLVEAYAKIEANLNLIGSTGIEDRLQEKVQITLSSLRKAGIKIWVLTGDKRETAINISESCKHFSPSMIKLLLTDTYEKPSIENKLNEHAQL
jgi:magnesium-transporting ATPase (P-type)